MIFKGVLFFITIQIWNLNKDKIVFKNLNRFWLFLLSHQTKEKPAFFFINNIKNG